MLVKEKKSTWINICKESAQRETEMYALSEAMAQDAKVDDGDKFRLKRSLLEAIQQT